MKIKRIAIAAGAVLALAGCSSISTQPDEEGLHYNAGSFSDTTFSNCVNSGTQNFDGPGDDHYKYPKGTRSYEFSNSRDRDHDPFKIVSQDNQELTVVGVLSFSLDTTCKVLRQFHEKIGIKYGAGEDGVKEWGKLLDVYLGNPLQSAMNDAAQQFPWQGLYNDPAIRAAWEKAVKQALPKYVEDFAGGPYFQTFTLIVQKPEPSSALVNQLRDQQVAQQQLQTINAQQAAVTAKIEQIKQLVAVLGPYGYILYSNEQACQDGDSSTKCIPVMPVPQGTNINVTPGG